MSGHFLVQVFKNAMQELSEQSVDDIIEQNIEELRNNIYEEDEVDDSPYSDSDTYSNIHKGSVKGTPRDDHNTKLFNFYGEEEY